jgi:hypothetical protein
MRYCNQCHQITPGEEPLFCNSCGSSFDVKLCAARHINPRNAEVCSQCGSRDFSTPAPPNPFWLRPVIWLASLFPGILLVLLSILFLIGVVNALLSSQQLRLQLVSVGILIAVLWWGYMHLPRFLRSLFGTLWRKTKKDR